MVRSCLKFRHLKPSHYVHIVFSLSCVYGMLVAVSKCRYTIGLDDSHFSPDGRPEPGWVLKLLCEDMCKTSNWQPAETGLMPARCDEFSSSLACPANRCRWGIDSSLPATGYDGLTLPHTKGNTVDACIPKKFCVVGCEMHSSVSLTCK